MSPDYDEQIKLLNRIIDQQSARISEQDTTIKELRTLVIELRSLKENLEGTLEEFRRQLFGTKSEKTHIKEEESSDPATADTPAIITKVKEHTRARKKKATREELYADIPIRDVICPVAEEDRLCGYCDAQMQLLCYKEVRTELRITPAKVERIRYLQEVLICPECRKDGDGTIAQAKTPAPLLPHSPASPSTVAYVMFHKSFVNTPYYRQEACMLQLGLQLPRETMANWYIRGALDYFRPIYERMHELLIQREIIHADETTCQVLHEEGKTPESKSYMWIYLSGSDGLTPIVLYDYQSGRSGDFPKNFLEGFSGMIQCDGYSGYNKVEDVILVCCVAHCRRKFFEAIPVQRRRDLKLLDVNSEETIKKIELPSSEEREHMIPAEVGLIYCNQLFFIEKGLKGMDPEERKHKRQELEVPVWDSFWTWIDTLDPLGGSKLAKAEYYAIRIPSIRFMIPIVCDRIPLLI
ncbi:IS66 family transposase [Lacrimispora brassicae]